MKNIALILIAIGLLGLGYIIGKMTIHPKLIESIKTTTDTMYQGYPIYVDNIDTIFVKSTPINPKTTFVERIIHDLDTMYLETNSATFTAIDTLRFDSLFVAIKDTGDCYGITNRESKLFGQAQRQIITNTIERTLIEKPKKITMYAGAGVGIGDKVDVYPTLGVNIKNRANITYGYSFISGEHQMLINFALRK